MHAALLSQVNGNAQPESNVPLFRWAPTPEAQQKQRLNFDRLIGLPVRIIDCLCSAVEKEFRPVSNGELRLGKRLVRAKAYANEQHSLEEQGRQAPLRIALIHSSTIKYRETGMKPVKIRPQKNGTCLRGGVQEGPVSSKLVFLLDFVCTKSLISRIKSVELLWNGIVKASHMQFTTPLLRRSAPFVNDYSEWTGFAKEHRLVGTGSIP